MANVLTNQDMLNNVNAYPTGLKTNILAGAGAATNVAVSGISLEDKIISAMQITAGGEVDLTAECAVTSSGNIQLSTTVTTGDTLRLTWYDKNP